MRPVKRNPTPVYKVPATIDIYSTYAWYGLTNIDKINPVSKSSQYWTYNTAQVLAFMANYSALNMGAVSWGNLSDPSIVETMKYLSQNVFTDGANTAYGNSRASLIANFGQYCSYCEVPVYDSALAVEHMLPKSVFADVMMCYPNFLLACPNCNSNKSAAPTYADATAWAVKKPNYEQIKSGGYFYAIWPDNRVLGTAEINNLAFNGFSFLLQYWDDIKKAWTDVSAANACSINNNWVSISKDNFAQANVQNIGLKEVKLVVINVVASGTDKTRAANMGELVKWNATTSADPKMSDRRVLNRSIAFFELLQAFKRLNYFVTHVDISIPANKQLYQDLCEQVVTTARYSGFYSVWLNTLNFISLANAPKTFSAEFKAATTDSTKSFAYFPGTDPTRLP